MSSIASIHAKTTCEMTWTAVFDSSDIWATRMTHGNGSFASKCVSRPVSRPRQVAGSQSSSSLLSGGRKKARISPKEEGKMSNASMLRAQYQQIGNYMK
ncbi:SRP54 domain-containing protein [Psidium guajava]|nr:SRP54 domain-containing protein [Psidium guajava]